MAFYVLTCCYETVTHSHTGAAKKLHHIIITTCVPLLPLNDLEWAYITYLVI